MRDSFYLRGRYDPDFQDFIIDFYKKQYLKFIKIGIGGFTEFNTLVTEILIKTTEQRLDQLIRGERTEDNTTDFEKGKYRYEHYYKAPKKYDSNRSFGWDSSTEFDFLDLDDRQRHSITNPTVIQPTYIDKYTTAYRTIGEGDD